MKPELENKPAAAAEPLLAVTILKTGTTVGEVILAQGETLRLPKSQAEALASITPPVAEITGI